MIGQNGSFPPFLYTHPPYEPIDPQFAAVFLAFSGFLRGFLVYWKVALSAWCGDRAGLSGWWDGGFLGFWASELLGLRMISDSLGQPIAGLADWWIGGLVDWWIGGLADWRLSGISESLESQ